MNLKNKVLIFSALLLAGSILTIITISSLQGSNASAKETAQLRLTNAIQMANRVLENEYAVGGADGMEEALWLLGAMTFDAEEGYFWVASADMPTPTLLMDPFNPDQTGKSTDRDEFLLVDDEEPNLYKHITKKVLKEGQTFLGHRASVGDDLPVMTHAIHFKPMNWVVGASTTKLEGGSGVSAFIWLWGLALVSLGVGLTAFFSKNIFSELSRTVDLLTNHTEDLPLRNDEVGALQRAVIESGAAKEETLSLMRHVRKGDFSAIQEPKNIDDPLYHEAVNTFAGIWRETQAVVDGFQKAIDQGKIQVGLDGVGKEGFWARFTETINAHFEHMGSSFRGVHAVINAMAQGDLSKRFEGKVIGDVQMLTEDLNRALDGLNDLLLQAANSAKDLGGSTEEMLVSGHEMNATTSEIASAISEMSSGAQSQVSQVDESSNLVEGILHSSNEVGEQAESINNAAKVGAVSSENGLKLIKKVGFSMKDIAAFSQDTNESFKVLAERSHEITRVLGVISDIAAQTNLLALNAAIEAAQAGDAGRGFAVVAEEIRKLAEDSRNSAKEIEQLITDVQNDTEQAAKVLEVMNESIQGGEEASTNASAAFQEIAESTSQTLGLSEKILNSAKKQIEDIKNVVSITESVVVIAEQTAAGTEEVASSATELSSGMGTYTVKSEHLTKVSKELLQRIKSFQLSDDPTSHSEEGLSGLESPNGL